MKIFEPKPPPTSGAMTRSLFSGASPMKRREHQPRDMRVLARRVERDRVGPEVVFADRRARLHRVRDQAIVDEIDLGHVLCRGERRVRRSFVAEMPIVDACCSARRHEPRATGIRGRLDVNHRRQHGVVNLDLFPRVARLRVSLGDDDGDVVADIAHLALGERGMGARFHWRAVLRIDHDAADEAADLVGRDVVAGEDRNDARRFQRRGRVDLVDCRMGVRRAQKIGMGLARTIDVVDVVALAGDEADVFRAFDGGANAGRAHEFSP